MTKKPVFHDLLNFLTDVNSYHRLSKAIFRSTEKDHVNVWPSKKHSYITSQQCQLSVFKLQSLPVDVYNCGPRFFCCRLYISKNNVHKCKHTYVCTCMNSKQLCQVN